MIKLDRFQLLLARTCLLGRQLEMNASMARLDSQYDAVD